jgi:hypothetical protein
MSVYNDCIVYLLAKAYQKAYACFKKRLHEYGLTPVQTLVIMGISEEEGLSAKDLGKRLLLDNATLSGVLALAGRRRVDHQGNGGRGQAVSPVASFGQGEGNHR